MFQFKLESFLELQQGREVRCPQGRESDVDGAEGKKSGLEQGPECY